MPGATGGPDRESQKKMQKKMPVEKGLDNKCNVLGFFFSNFDFFGFVCGMFKVNLKDIL